jgi:uncharacterized protein YecE (DUF72 family)
MSTRSSQHHPQQESFAFMDAPLPGKTPSPPFEARALASLAARGIFLGTSSWKYRGWEGLIYRGGYSSEAQFQRASLREYTFFFPTVGIEFTYFTWPLADMMAYLAESTPDHFQLCLKVTKRITLKAFPTLPVYGKWAGKTNPDYLSPEQFRECFLPPLKLLGSRLGLLIFELTDFCRSDEAQIKSFFSSLDIPCRLSVQLWGEKPTDDFLNFLVENGIAPAIHIHFGGSSALEQWRRLKEMQNRWNANLPLVFLPTQNPTHSPEEAHQRFSPFDKLVAADPESRAVAVDLCNRALETNRKVFALVSNRWEGSAPQSIGCISQALMK